MNCANFNKLPLSSKFTPAARSRGIAVWCFACILLSLTRQFHVGASCWWQSAETAVLGVWEYIAQSQLLGNTLCSREGLWMYLEQEDQWLAEADSGLNSSLVVSAPQSALQEKGKPCFVAFDNFCEVYVPNMTHFKLPAWYQWMWNCAEMKSGTISYVTILIQYV